VTEQRVQPAAMLPQPAPGGLVRRVLPTVIRVGVSCGLILWLFSRVPVHISRVELSIAPLAAALVLLLVQPLVMTWRWRLLLSALSHPLPFELLMRLLFISIFFNQALPAAVGGDVVRAYYTSKEGVPLAPLIASIVVDRVFALVGILAIVGLFLLSGSEMVPDRAARISLLVVCGVGVGGWLLAVILAPLMESLATRLKLPAFLLELVACWRQCARRPVLLACGFLLSVATHVLSFAAILLIAMGLGWPVSLIEGTAAGSFMMLSQNLPISIGGWGVREWASTVALGGAGSSTDQALLISVLLGVLFLIASIPGAFFWASMRTRVAPVSSGSSGPEASGDAKDPR
jgi:glycosyltransferase 2 family protein